MLELDNVRDHRALGLDDDRIVDMYRAMLLARRVDERMWTLNRQGRVPFVLSAAGHEAAQVATAFALDLSTDWALPYYRDVAFNLAAGVTPMDMFLSVFSKADDPASGGRQMPNHWSEPNVNIFTHSSVIATQFPHACGIAYWLQLNELPGVVMVSSGEGATSEGDWHEAMNFAGIHKLPMVFLIENNLYAISVPVIQEVAGSIVDRAAGYGMPGVEVDGNDALAVYGVMSAAVQRARDGDGPTLVEAMTYRYYAHTSDDDDKLYRSAEEVDLWRRKDPVTRLRQYLVESRLLDEATETAMDREITESVAAAAKEAAPAPAP
nr:thiamine pyrophosphate-dependent dehydrogenase E1 component subunit alpha [Acidimicrobiia bacterium]